MTGILRAPRRAALITITMLVTAASAASFAESYRGLFEWASHHGLSGIWAAGFPLQVDVFIAVGELALFVALADSWERRSRIGAWLVTIAGLAVSVAGNVGHIAGHALADRATTAIPPLAAAAALAVGLGVLKRVVGPGTVPPCQRLSQPCQPTRRSPPTGPRSRTASRCRPVRWRPVRWRPGTASAAARRARSWPRSAPSRTGMVL